jgi:hypothetical protein
MFVAMSVRHPVRGFVLVLCALACGSIIGPAAAQEKVAAPEPEEAETLATGAKEIDAFAALAQKSGFPGRAKQAWFEVIGEYAADDEAARKALGFVKQGPIWKRDPAFEFPDKDQLDPAAARTLDQKWQTIAARLGAAHRALAEKLAAAGKKERADHHLQRALRFVPSDGKAIEESGRRQFEGIAGDDVDITIVQRSRLMDRAITKLADQAYAAELASVKQPMLDELGIAYIAVKSANFTMFGDWDAATLQQAAAWSERALAFCEEAFAGYDIFPSKAKQTRQFIFLKQKEAWDRLVRKYEKGQDPEFTVKNAKSTTLGDVEAAAVDHAESVFDMSVRRVVWDYSGITQDALREGIGHAIVGMFFGRNLFFSVGQADPKGTVAGKPDSRFTMPDLDTWKELAVEIAWQQGAVPAARLPLIKSSDFPNDARIKAWSFCDYLLRRDPVLLNQLQKTASKSRNEADVLAAFQDSTHQSLQQIEERWRRFWTEDTPLRRAVVQKITPLESTSREAPPWLEALNKLRAECDRKPLGWSSDLTVACHEHVEYLKANKDQRGADKEHVELAGKTGYSNSGRAFAPQALVWTRDPKKAVEAWMSLPGYRDAVLNKSIDTVGLYVESGIAVFDVDRGRTGSTTVIAANWPDGSQGGRAKNPVPAAVDVEQLGPEVQQLLAANNRGKQKQVGYPLSLHGFSATLTGVTCKVTCGNDEVAGFLVEAKGSIRRTSSPGLWVFYPAEPLKRGPDIRAEWKWANGSHTVTFVAK